MLKKFCAILLLVICAFNAFGVGDKSFFIGADDDGSVVNAQISIQHSEQANATDTLTASHGEDHHSGDSSQEHHGIHICHLGHCDFTLGESKIYLPNLITTRIAVDTESYTSADLVALQRPPLA